MQLDDAIWVNIGLGIGLLPDTKKAITQTNDDFSSKVFSGIHLSAISHEVLMNLIHNVYPEILLFNLLPLPHISEGN